MDNLSEQGSEWSDQEQKTISGDRSNLVVCEPVRTGQKFMEWSVWLDY